MEIFMTYILPVIIFMAIGAAAGGLLVLATKFLAVKEDETVAKIAEVLPNANCGACGFAGCDAYAEAVADGKAEANLCVPGGPDVAGQLSDILGVEVSVGEPKVAYVNCSGDCSAVAQKTIYEGLQSCKAAAMVYGGPFSCKFGCIGLGDCVAECPVGAISVKDTLAHIDPRVCIACGKCVKTCPKGVISLVGEDVVVAVACSNKEKGALARKNCMNACIGCKKCEKTCQHDAIKVIDNLAVIDYAKCEDCGECAKVCPTGRLKVVDMKNGVIG